MTVDGEKHGAPDFVVRILRRDGDLDHGQRVDVEVVDEVGRRGHLVGGGARDLFDDLRESGQNLLVSHLLLL